MPNTKRKRSKRALAQGLTEKQMAARRSAAAENYRSRLPDLFGKVQPGINPHSPVAWSQRTTRDFVPGVGLRVRLLRVAYGWTQIQLGAKAGIPEPKITAMELERHRGSVSLKNAIKLARALDTSLDYLAGLTADPTPRR